MSERRFDLIVIGSGPAGEKGAAQAAYHGYSVALVEQAEVLGGAVVNNAGIPSKTLREAGRYLTGFQERDTYGLGLDLEPYELFQRLNHRTSVVSDNAARSVGQNLARHEIELVRGRARFVDQRLLEVSGPGGDETLSADVVLIASGSAPMHPDGIDFSDPDVLDSDTIVGLGGPINSMVVVGGGAIACEYASILAAVGVEVTLVHRHERLLHHADPDATDDLAAAFRSIGVDLRLDSYVSSVKRGERGLDVDLGEGGCLHPDKLFFAAGRAGRTAALSLENAGVETDSHDRIIVDDFFATSAPGIYAAGDVLGAPGLASVSMEQARVAMCMAFDIPLKTGVDALFPSAVYSVPEIAWVGKTEAALRAEDIGFVSGKAPFADNPRAMIAGHPEGGIKLIAESSTHRLLGVHIVGEDASELIHIGQAAMHAHAPIEYFIDSTFNVPTRSDLYKYAAYETLSALEEQES
jgi:NAD(P) transhydrogenase